MIFKKNQITNFIWIVASVVIGLNMVCYTRFVLDLIPFTKKLLAGQAEKAGAIQIGIAFVLMLLLVGVYFGVHAIVKAVSGKVRPLWNGKKKLKSIMELLVFLLLMGGSVTIRLMVILSNRNPVILDTGYFEMALVRMNASTLVLEHNASYFYVNMLSFVMRFLGNKVISAVALQFVFQMISLAFMYLGLRKLTGFYPALVCTAIFAFNPAYIHLMYVVDAQCLITMLFCVSLYFIGRIYQIFYRELSSANLVLSIVFAGLFSGLCCYLEPYGLVIFLFVFLLFFRDSEWFEQGVKAFLAGGIFISAAGVMAFLFTFESMKDNVDIINPIRSWYTFLQDVDPIHFAFFDKAYAADTKWLGFMMVCGAFLLIPGYLARKKVKYIAFFVLALTMAPVPFGSMGYLAYQTMAPWIWAVLAGYGVQMMLTTDDSVWKATDEEPQAEPEPEPRPMEKPRPRRKQLSKPITEVNAEVLVEPAAEETPEPEPEEPVMEPEPEPVEESESVPEPVVESEPVPEPVEESEPVPEPAPEQAAEVEQEPVAEMESVSEPAITEAEKESELKWEETVTEQDTEPVKEPVEEPEAESEPELEPIEESEPEPEPEPEPIEESEPEPEPEPEPEIPKKVELIPNPLPVPKKHVRKKADFALDIDEDDLDFDFDVAEDDDFDL